MGVSINDLREMRDAMARTLLKRPEYRVLNVVKRVDDTIYRKLTGEREA
jgi:hypothetical protein